MLLENKIYTDDLDRALQENLSWDKLDGKSILITGAAGMIGSSIVDLLLYRNKINNSNIKIYALGRTRTKLEIRFANYMEDEKLEILEQDISKPFIFNKKIDYIVHAASNADPNMMAHYPVDTLLANVIGVNNLLSYARDNGITRLLYVSSGEMYGQADATVTNGFDEDYCGAVNYASPRSCYPSGKRAAEVLCHSYESQYGIETVIARPCHCYGPTMTVTDSRAISQFFRKVLEGEDIVLKSDGSMERSQCYVVDAAMAMLYILLEGKSGNAYNIADKKSQSTIKELATLIAETKSRKIIFDLPNETEKKGFSAVTKPVLNAEKLEGIGWRATTDLKNGVEKTMQILGEIE